MMRFIVQISVDKNHIGKDMETANGDTAYVILVKSRKDYRARYFMGISKRGAVQTAWSLHAAKLFSNWRMEDIKVIQMQIKAKGYYSTEVVKIEVQNNG